MENVECFNHKNESLNRMIPRENMKNAVEYFRVLHAWIVNDKGQYLVQKRAKKDDLKPFMWAFTTGMLNPQEDPLEGIIREVAEEVHIKTSKKDWHLEKIVSTHVHPYKTHTYVFKIDWNQPIDFTPTQEVSKLAWWSLETIQKAIDKGEFWDYPKLLNDSTYFLGGPHE